MPGNTPKKVTIQIQNNSGTEIYLATSEITAGQWEAAPVPGTVFNRTELPVYVNGTGSALEDLGGKLMLSPATGGFIKVQWDWKAGKPLRPVVTTEEVEVLVTQTVSNKATMAPIIQVIISNNAALSALTA